MALLGHHPVSGRSLHVYMAWAPGFSFLPVHLPVHCPGFRLYCPAILTELVDCVSTHTMIKEGLMFVERGVT